MESSHNGSRTSLSGSGLPLAPHALQGLISDAQPRVDFLLAAQALEVLFMLYMKLVHMSCISVIESHILNVSLSFFPTM